MLKFAQTKTIFDFQCKNKQSKLAPKLNNFFHPPEDDIRNDPSRLWMFQDERDFENKFRPVKVPRKYIKKVSSAKWNDICKSLPYRITGEDTDDSGCGTEVNQAKMKFLQSEEFLSSSKEII